MTQPALLPPNERQRLERLRSLTVLDTEPEPIFDALTRMASAACGTPVALVSLIDAERQWFKSNFGLPGVRETPRDVAFCAHALLHDGITEVPDATLDARFAANPLVTGRPDIRFYAGAPITMEGGERIGTLCVLDHRPRTLTDAQRALLCDLAVAVSQALALRERTLDRALAARSGFEAELAGNVALLDSVLGHLPAAVASFGADLRLRYASPLCQAWIGLEGEPLLGRRLDELVGAKAARQSRRRFAAVLAGRLQAFDASVPVPGLGLGVRRQRVQMIPNRLADGTRDGCIVLATDVTEERRSQQLAAQLAAIVEASHDAIVGSDLEGTITSWNAGAERLFGHSATEALGQPLAVLYPPQRQGEAPASRAGRCHDAPPAAPVRTQRLRRDGSELTVSATVSPIRDAAGRTVGVSEIVRDIGERQRAEEALARSEARHRALVEDQTELVSLACPDGVLTFVNTAYAAHFGKLPQQMVGTSLYDHIAPVDRPIVAARLRAACDSGSAVAGENRTVMPDGSGSWVAWTNRAITDAAGRSVEVHSVGRDVTDLKAVESALRASEQKFRLLSEASPFGVFHADATGACTYANAQWQRICGLSPTQALGDGWTQALHPDDRDGVFAEWRRSSASGDDFGMEFRLRRPDGEERLVRARARWLTATDGAAEGCVGAVEDITERRQATERLRDSEALLEHTGRIAGVGGWALDLRRGRVSWSAQTYRIHEVPHGYEPTLEGAIGFYAPQARPVIERAVQAGMADGTPWDLELPFVTHAGRATWVRALGEVEFEKGQAVRLVGAFQDIGDRKRAEHELAQSHELLRITLQSIGDAVITTDAESRVEWLNPVAERLTGWANAEARGLALTQVFRLVDEASREPAESPVARCLGSKTASDVANPALLISRDGAEYGIEESAAPIRSGQGVALGVVLVFRDVTAQRRLSSELSHRARHDPLTGLVNRAEFEARLARLLHSVRDGPGGHALMFIDLDQFKQVNDACGHAAGDRLLCQVSALLRSRVRTRDTLARLGGDEFGVLLENCSVEQAQRVAQAVCDQMETFRFVHDGRQFRIGTSIGLVPVDRRWTGAPAALQAADASCYAAKEAGRNRVHVWFDSDQARLARQSELGWADRLAQAFDEERFRLHARRVAPIGRDGRLGDGSGLHCEVLLRLREGNGSLTLPGAFMPAAERFHMASRIDRWVLRQVMNVLAGDDTAPGRIALLTVRLSGPSISDRSFHDHVCELIATVPAAARKLCFEIAESTAIAHLADAAVFAADMRALGVRIALGEFGACAAPFGHLKTLTVDYLKIDARFTLGLLDDPLDHAAVRCFREVSTTIGAQTVADGVDRADTLAELRRIGIDHAQGDLIDRVEPLEDMLLGDVVAVAVEA